MASGLGASLTRRTRLACVLAAAAALAAAGLACSLARDPDIVLLRARGGASWIVVPQPLFLGTRVEEDVTGFFRRSFFVDKPLEAVLEFQALRVARLRLDGREVALAAGHRLWKVPRRAVLSLGSGEHELMASVRDRHGPAAFWAASPELDLATGAAWQASADGKSWAPARPAEEPMRVELSGLFPSPTQGLARRGALLGGVFLAVFLLSAALQRRKAAFLSPEAARWGLLAAWGLLALNNIGKLPFGVGFDVAGHIEYIEFVVRYWALPLPAQGWQMFQSPLYYMMSAPLYAAAAAFGPLGPALAARLLPWLCGAAQVQLSFLALREALPQRRDLQVMGMTLAGLLPMTLYSAQYAGNEPLCSALTAAVIVLAWRWRRRPSPLGLAAVGVALGLALLAKVTALLIVPSVAALVVLAAPAGRKRGRILKDLALIAGPALLLCGWYYGRTWLAVGSPFVGGWDASRGIVWWQDPGFRTPARLLGFGESLRRPIYACLAGFWDSLYSTLWLDGSLSSMISYSARPPWDAALLVAAAWLALVPTTCIAMGFLRGLWRRESLTLFCGGSAALYLSALFYLYLKVPIYSTAKATYLGGLSPCLALLACGGFDVLSQRGPWARALLHGFMGCWAAAVLGTYWIA